MRNTDKKKENMVLMSMRISAEDKELMENYNEFEVNEQRFKVTYKYEKNLVWALTYVNGQEVKAHGDTDQTAYWAIQNHVNTILNFRL